MILRSNPTSIIEYFLDSVLFGASSLGRGCLTGVSREEARGYGFPPIPWEYVTIWATGYCNCVGDGVEMVKKRQ